MNRKYKKGAEDVGKVAEKGFNKIADEVKGVSEELGSAAEKQHAFGNAVIEKLEEITYGFTVKGNALEKISEGSRTILLNTLHSIKSFSESPSEDACTYYAYFYSILDIPLWAKYDPQKLELVSAKDAAYILYVLLEYKTFFWEQAVLDYVDHIAGYINISRHQYAQLESAVKETVHDIGLGGILRKYENKADKAEVKRLKKELEAERKKKEEKQKAESATQGAENTDCTDIEPESSNNLDKMVSKSKKAVIAATAAAMAIGAMPIPFADLPVLVGEQVTLMASIAAIFKIEIKKDGLKTLALAALGVGGGALVGRAIAANLVKLIPVLGTVSGGALNGSVAGIMTSAMGNAFIEVCKAVKLGRLKQEDITSSKGIDLFKEAFTTNAKNSKTKA